MTWSEVDDRNGRVRVFCGEVVNGVLTVTAWRRSGRAEGIRNPRVHGEAEFATGVICAGAWNLAFALASEVVGISGARSAERAVMDAFVLRQGPPSGNGIQWWVTDEKLREAIERAQCVTGVVFSANQEELCGVA